jgi:DNA-binding GntR family transcriptional regulator
MSSHDLVETLRDDILSGRIRPGEELRQTALAERFGVSRIPVRDAISVLAKERLVITSPNQSARVVQLTTKEHIEIFDLREILECHALSHAIRNMTDAHVSNLHHVHHRTSLEAGRPGWAEGDQDFHITLYTPSALDRTMAMISELRQVCRIQLSSYDRLEERTMLWLEQHEEIVFYSEKRDDKNAVRVLKQHISGAKVALLGAIEPS